MTYDDQVAARTIYGEARGEGPAGMDAVAHVIRNRFAAKRFGKTIAAVCLAKYQFSCWLEADPNSKLLHELPDSDPELKTCMGYWLMSLSTPDPTHGATHYHVVGTFPRWADGVTPLVTIGHHAFYKVA
jgi:N-acetylmuramoyl-L-alanine amidase